MSGNGWAYPQIFWFSGKVHYFQNGSTLCKRYKVLIEDEMRFEDVYDEHPANCKACQIKKRKLDFLEKTLPIIEKALKDHLEYLVKSP
jgi:hypothetical protein